MFVAIFFQYNFFELRDAVRVACVCKALYDRHCRYKGYTFSCAEFESALQFITTRKQLGWLIDRLKSEQYCSRGAAPHLRRLETSYEVKDQCRAVRNLLSGDPDDDRVQLAKMSWPHRGSGWSGQHLPSHRAIVAALPAARTYYRSIPMCVKRKVCQLDAPRLLWMLATSTGARAAGISQQDLITLFGEDVFGDTFSRYTVYMRPNMCRGTNARPKPLGPDAQQWERRMQAKLEPDVRATLRFDAHPGNPLVFRFVCEAMTTRVHDRCQTSQGNGTEAEPLMFSSDSES